MNDTFDLNRWWMLVTKHWYDNRRKYVFSILTVAILMLSIYILMMLGTSFHKIDRDAQAGICFAGLFFVGALFASMLFAELGSKSKAIAYLTLPASTLEKLLCAMFYGVFAFSAVFLAIFYTLDTAAVNICNEVQYQSWVEYNRENPTNATPFEPEKVVNIFVHQSPDYSEEAEALRKQALKENRPFERPEKADAVYGYFWAAFICIEALFALGSVYFGKFSFIKTCVALFAVFLVFLLLFYVLGETFPHNMNFFEMTDDGNDMRSVYRIPQWVLDTEIYLLIFALPALLWFVSYQRLSEKEV